MFSLRLKRIRPERERDVTRWKTTKLPTLPPYLKRVRSATPPELGGWSCAPCRSAQYRLMALHPHAQSWLFGGRKTSKRPWFDAVPCLPVWGKMVYIDQ